MTILLLTNRMDYTADFVVLELQNRKLDYVRFNTEDASTRVGICWSPDNFAKNYLEIGARRISLESITSIWYRRPVSPFPSPEITDVTARRFAISESFTTFAGVWRSLNCCWVSHPDSLYAASFKIVQLQRAKRLGFNIPSTLITNIVSEANTFLTDIGTEAIYKPISMSRIESPDGNKLIFTNRLRPEHLKDLEAVKYAPAQFQEFVEKQSDVRVTVIGSEVFAVVIDSQVNLDTQVDWRRGDASLLPHRVIELPSEIKNKCLSLVSDFGLKFGAIDLVLSSKGEYYFLEINPNGQWAWIEQLTGLPLTATLVDLLSDEAE